MSKRQSKDANNPAEEFLEAVRDVQPLPDRGRVVHAPKRVTPIPFQRQEDDRQVLRDSLSDEAEPDLELESGEELAFVRPGLSRLVLRRLRSGRWATQDQLDLHGSRSEEARALLVDFLARAVRRGHRCVIIVHGKGLGSKNREPVLKRKLARWLAQRNEVLAFCQAKPANGGSGAAVVLLKGAKSKASAASSDEEEDY